RPAATAIANSVPTPSRSLARQKASLSPIRQDNLVPAKGARLSWPLGTLQGKLCEHSLPHLLIFKTFVKGGYTGINHIEDATQDTLEYHRGLIIEVGGLLHIGTEHFVTESC